MHLAVDFGKYTDERASLVALFVERDLAALRNNPAARGTFLDVADHDGLSVYQEHERTRLAVSKSYDKWLQSRNDPEKSRRDESVNGMEPPGKSAVRAPRAAASSREIAPRREGPSKGAGDRANDRPERGPEKELDERELLRQKKKAEEAARLKDGHLSTKAGLREERDGQGRDNSRARPARASDLPANLTQLNTNARNTEPAPNTPIKRSSTARFDAKPAQEKPVQERPRPRPAMKSMPSRKKGTMPEWTKNSDALLLSLKLHYMRTRNEEMALSFLYGTNFDDVRISFDYDRLPRKIVWSDFTNRLGKDHSSGIKFDRVLQYVSFPHVEVTERGIKADRERDAELKTGIRQLGGLGRKDMKYFFNWLHSKGVRHIIQLSVEDSGDANGKVHSDQAIQDSLERFVVDNLDWRKTDLDPETILHVSSKATEKEGSAPEETQNALVAPEQQLKQIYLRWSGSSAVLRAWGGSDGLAMLPRLETVYLFRPSSEKLFDNTQWTNKKIREFQDRLNRNRRLLSSGRVEMAGDQETLQVLGTAASDNQSQSDVEGQIEDVQVIATDVGTEEQRNAASRDRPHFSASSPAKGVNSHRWLDSTARFAEEMKPFWDQTVLDFLQSRQNKGTAEGIENDVVVALIDDGVDVFETAYSNQVLEGKSFDFHNGKVRPPFSSARGHGSVMANMILRICPMAKVYPIRLRTFDNPNGKTNIDKDYAAQAVQAALDKKATIISMSWTLPMSKDKSDEAAKNKLHKVLEKAVERNVLMFCSAPDEGKFSEFDYPSGPWRDRFFRIGAASADGKVFSWTPEVGITYVLPGVDVVKDQISSRVFDTSSSRGASSRAVEIKYETGSSVATALAAGLAAMIMYCVKASILAVKTANQNKGDIVGFIPDDGATLIADPDAMKRAFAQLGSVTSNKFVQVWEELDKVSEVLETWRRTSNPPPEVKLGFIREYSAFGLKLAASIKP
ncbi:hypothetical protein F5X68DRAFT_202092 [Plectosphaerella plurivora]|uniref:Peptidase S8/S53 domain-containing protein n=1 Tax=Plectosphaerella plurivora TaxID=936078 RepID=A0A9P9AAT8_9PEZI|nr:hypothetical protein F5X68DRAFT_202092 [Plectosphaerella plurivora]